MTDDDAPADARNDEHPDRPWEGYDELADRRPSSGGRSADADGDGDTPDDGRGGTDDWASPWGDNPLQRHYSWPATREHVPSLDGSRVLDAGCGVGAHVDWLLDRGASVVGVDASKRAVERVRERFGDRATFEQTDLSGSLPFEDGSFDVVLSHLVLDHVADLTRAFESFHRVLVDGGVLVFTVVHPFQLFSAYDEVDRYYEPTPVELGWDAPVTTFHRPLSAVLTPLAGAGFRLDRFAEPEPPASYLPLANDDWEVQRRPQICVVRATAE
ncbi:class I SAM-dependent methyltransferase [Haloarchaeobius sp. HRN-SO-5]|uniref:class I SAM-dependent methyltransferase n=1 Tax=Haloarchaeobius sp. HRN-SO-5 TaxID=3446118 RepID=UPI003EB6DDC5